MISSELILVILADPLLAIPAGPEQSQRMLLGRPEKQEHTVLFTPKQICEENGSICVLGYDHELRKEHRSKSDLQDFICCSVSTRRILRYTLFFHNPCAQK